MNYSQRWVFLIQIQFSVLTKARLPSRAMIKVDWGCRGAFPWIQKSSNWQGHESGTRQQRQISALGCAVFLDFL